jgi:lipoprotein-anchoring transpeptidase ErfK/SrfK
VALAAGAGIASAAGTTVLTAAPSPAVVTYPDPARIIGTLTDDTGGLSGQALELVQRPAGTTGDWLPAGGTTTGAGGTFSFRVTPSDSTDYQVRYPAGSPTPTAQAETSVAVRPLVTVSFPAGLWLGQTVLLRGRVQPAHAAGTAVNIDRKVDGVWEPFVTATLNDTSRFAFRWTPTEFGYYRLRARVDADEKHNAGVSAARTVIVNRPNAHNVPMRYAHYLVNVIHEYRLYYYEHGVLVRGFDVALGRPGYRTPLGLFRVYGKRKPAGGALGACAMFYRRQGGIAIHGTDQPYLIRRPIPRDFSHGCTRMLNNQVLWLYARVPLRTYVHNLP